MAQSRDLDYYSVAAKTSEVRIFQIALHQGQVKGLEKAMAMTSHKREVLSVAYDSSQSGKYCATTAKDQCVIVYALDSHFKQAKLLIAQEIASLSELTLSSLCVVEKFSTQKPVAYVALAEGSTFEVYSGVIAADGEIKQLSSVIRVTEAQQDAIQQIELFFDTGKEELYLLTSAKLDHRLNIWRVPTD